MKRFLAMIVILVLAPLWAADPPGYNFWSGAQLKDYGKILGPKLNAQKVATESLANYGNHSLMAIYREGSGEAEVHETQADFFIVQSGQAVLVVGGTVVGGRTTGPGEIRGASISGGEKKDLAPGDIVHIPPKIPHQVLLGEGQRFTYLVVKVDSK
jgi:mannose-6-phosphate isomerase-like protein (cupin superfamily)